MACIMAMPIVTFLYFPQLLLENAGMVPYLKT